MEKQNDTEKTAITSNGVLADSKNLRGWMPIDGIRLPERGEKVLVLFGKIENILIGRRMNDADGNDVWTVFFSDGEHLNFGKNAEDITHWMELPKLPSVG